MVVGLVVVAVEAEGELEARGYAGAVAKRGVVGRVTEGVCGGVWLGRAVEALKPSATQRDTPELWPSGACVCLGGGGGKGQGATGPRERGEEREGRRRRRRSGRLSHVPCTETCRICGQVECDREKTQGV